MAISHKEWIIRRVTANDVAAALAFIIPMLHEVYPNIPDVAVRWDLANMEEAYVSQENSVMFAAFDNAGQVVGTIAIRPYDDRIEAVRGYYDLPGTAELSRCYVKSSLRRQGLAGVLVAAIESYCRQYGYQTICLHTHRFLPGGFPFWLSQGYMIRTERTEEIETVYMDKDVFIKHK
ncbi:GNAT family N-acetyltransferase [Sporomusa malonica]|uniref:Acetyltransferase (GNAT) domain-containing protein n=1 Tax=Sporomusa malonica TaxID=112901 RepID=A0A1W2DVG1_9FIRM|nr:GNAT family N-acetyltransferase [Sporomusa malonica]SMD01451.1 Acetyltransferase (GNAT) domain-containing protein [Sporomusa malonica]